MSGYELLRKYAKSGMELPRVITVSKDEHPNWKIMAKTSTILRRKIKEANYGRKI